MDITLYNTLSRKKEVFKPIKAGHVSMYHCGPTVYDTPHIGNYRTFILADLLRRLFTYNGYEVNQVMNITDVDDKTIRRSQEEKVSLTELTGKYEKLFHDEIAELNILTPQFLRATDNIPEMIVLISDLLEKKIAYIAKDGVYLSIKKVNDYGQLAGLDLSANTEERIRSDEYDKENPRDFSLWKFKTEEDGPVFWEAPFGQGRPGWHIECSAMSMKKLGLTLDIHTGATDLIFPHHTNEIAQSESVTGKKFVNYWIHGAFMNVEGDKMAKSKGNFLKLSDLKKEYISPLAYRYWLLTSHYRSPVNFTYEAVQGAQNAFLRLIVLVQDYPEGGEIITSYNDKFTAFINDDLNTPQALALAWELVKDDTQNEADKKATLLEFDKVFGLKLDSVPKVQQESIPAEIQALAEAREEARKNKEWKKADALREEIEKRGYELKDTEKGPTIVPRG